MINYFSIVMVNSNNTILSIWKHVCYKMSSSVNQICWNLLVSLRILSVHMVLCRKLAESDSDQWGCYGYWGFAWSILWFCQNFEHCWSYLWRWRCWDFLPKITTSFSWRLCWSWTTLYWNSFYYYGIES